VQPGDKEATNNSAHPQRQFETQMPYAPEERYTPNPLKGTFRTVVIKKSKQ